MEYSLLQSLQMQYAVFFHSRFTHACLYVKETVHQDMRYGKVIFLYAPLQV